MRNAPQIVTRSMYELNQRVVKEGQRRGMTSGIFDRTATNVTVGPGFVVGQLIADDYWVFVGNGRAPGGTPPIDSIKAWVERAGIDASPWAIARSIAKRGSKSWRQGKTNVFLDSIDKWENDGVNRLEEEAGLDLENEVVETLETNMAFRQRQTLRQRAL